MNTLVIVLIAACCLVAGYIFYGRWLANKWGIDAKAKTLAVTKNDDQDYVPTDGWVVFAHQFSSIAGAVVGLVVAHPTMNLPAYTGFHWYLFQDHFQRKRYAKGWIRSHVIGELTGCPGPVRLRPGFNQSGFCCTNWPYVLPGAVIQEVF